MYFPNVHRDATPLRGLRPWRDERTASRADTKRRPRWSDPRLWTILMIPAAFLPEVLTAGTSAAAVINKYWFLIGFTPAFLAFGIASAEFARMRDWFSALQTTAAYGVGVGFLPAVAEFLQGPGPLFRSVAFILPIVPAVGAGWSIAAAWLETFTPETPKGHEERRRAARWLAAVLGAFATLEASALLFLVRAVEAPRDCASASQTACSTTVELLTFGVCAFVIIFPAFVLLTLAAVMRTRAIVFAWAAGPGYPLR